MVTPLKKKTANWLISYGITASRFQISFIRKNDFWRCGLFKIEKMAEREKMNIS